LTAGTLSGLFSLGAPAIAVYFFSTTDTRESYLANLQFLFAVTNIASLGMRIAHGYYTQSMLLPTAVGFAALLMGQRIGDKISGHLDKEHFSRFIYSLVGLSGLISLLRQL
jgi:uncharacterized membrane protein YfcA